MPLHFEIVVRKMESFKRENVIEIFEFVLLAFAIPGICIGIIGISTDATLNFILYGIEGASPALATLIVVFVHGKRTGLSSFLCNKYCKNLNLKFCILGFAVPFVILTIAKFISIAMGDSYHYPVVPTMKKLVIIAWALIAEELGWRGYLQDKLESIMPYMYIPFVTGIIWTLWHYHFILSGSMEVPYFAFMLGCVFESYGYYAITKLAKNNVVPASIWHFTGNLMFNLYRFDPQWHEGNISFYWITTICYGVNVILFIVYVKKCRESIG